MLPWIYEHILTIVIASPLLGILLLAALPRKYEEASSEIALFSSGLTLFLSIFMFSIFDFTKRFAFLEEYRWLPPFGSSYHVAVDGMSVMLILVVSLIILFTVLIHWKRVRSLQKEAFASLLAFEMGLIGLFSSIDILLIYIFMEFGVIFLGTSIMFLGSTVRKGLSRFVGFMSFSSLLILTIIIFLILSAGSSDLLTIEKISLTAKAQMWMLAVLLVGVFCRMGLFPFHSWVNDLIKDSREKGLLLIGLLFISGAYVLYRLLPPFAVAAVLLRPYLSWIVVSSIIVSALIALAQRNFGSLIIYVFMAHFGFVLLGLVSINPQGFAGSGMQMIGLSLSLSIVTVIFTLLKERGINLYAEESKGVFATTPIFGLLFLVIMFALTGLPGLSHFPGLFMIWMGLFKGSWQLAMVSLIGIVLISASIVGMSGLALFRGEVSEDRRRGLKMAEVICVVPFVFLVLWIGIFPDVILKYIKQSTEAAWILFSNQI